MKKGLFIICFFCCLQSLQSQVVMPMKITELETLIRDTRVPMLVNFWATWCKPCLAEIPGFEETVKKFSKDSLQILLVSLDSREDFPEGIVKTVNQRHFTSPLAWLDETNADYFCPKIDSSWTGAIPASLLVNPKTGQRKFFEQPLTPQKLEKEIMAILGR